MKTYIFKLNDQSFNYQIRFSKKRKRNIAIKFITDNSFEVSSPDYISANKIYKWLTQNHDWLAKHYIKWLSTEYLVQKPNYSDGADHLYLGCVYQIKLRDKSVFKQSSLEASNNLILLSYLKGSDVKHSLFKWYRKQAKDIFMQRMHQLLRLTPWVIEPPLLSIRLMTTRWGSYSNRGSISLNLHLIKAPLECIDYVILHELCHAIELNHSPKFYKYMQQVCPDWRIRRQQLNDLNIIN